MMFHCEAGSLPDYVSFLGQALRTAVPRGRPSLEKVPAASARPIYGTSTLRLE